MESLAWTAGTWTAFAVIATVFRKRLPYVEGMLRRENIAMVLALLGTFSLAPVAEAEEVLREPVVAERLMRGALAGLALLVAVPVLIQRLRAGTRPGHRAMAALVIYLLVGMASTLYSAAPLVTAAKIFELSAGLVPVLAVAYGPEPGRRLRDMLLLVFLGLVALTLVGAVGFFLLPDTFAFLESRPGFLTERTLFPPFAHSNTAAAFAALVGVFSLAQALGSGELKVLWRVAAVVAPVTLVLASGRQGVIMYLVGCAIVLWVERRRLLILALAPAVAGTFWVFREEVIDALSRDRPTNLVTLTGRIGFWEAAIETWASHPWTGWGFGSGGRFVVLNSLGRGGTSSLHSGFFEALTGVGILGAIPLLYAIVRVASWSVRHLHHRVDTALAVLIFPLLLRTSVSLGFGGWLTVEFVVFAILVALADEDYVRQRARAPHRMLRGTRPLASSTR